MSTGDSAPSHKSPNLSALEKNNDLLENMEISLAISIYRQSFAFSRGVLKSRCGLYGMDSILAHEFRTAQCQVQNADVVALRNLCNKLLHNCFIRSSLAQRVRMGSCVDC